MKKINIKVAGSYPLFLSTGSTTGRSYNGFGISIGNEYSPGGVISRKDAWKIILGNYPLTTGK